MSKNLHIWLPGYLLRLIQQGDSHKKRDSHLAATHIIFCLVDHFEPRWEKVGVNKELERVDAWMRGYSEIITRHKDSDGCVPRYSFFYPIDEFTPDIFGKIARFCKQGLGEIEIQLHHDHDTADSLREKLEAAKNTFSQYGVLSRDKSDNAIKYGFIHGNWALDNSRSDGRWCGVNNELGILAQTGCYADFTLPSAPSETQTKKINSIYYAQDTPEPKSHNTGRDVEVQQSDSHKKRDSHFVATAGLAMTKRRQGDCHVFCDCHLAATAHELMIIQGPLALNWRKRKYGILPRIENAEISFENPPTEDRIDLWVKQGISVKGKPDWIFVKVHTHGAKDEHLTQGYFRRLDGMFSYLEEKYNDGGNYVLHYMTAREMYNIIKAVEAGESGEPGEYRNYRLVL